MFIQYELYYKKLHIWISINQKIDLELDTIV